MIRRDPMTESEPVRGFSHYLALARLAIWWERLWPAIWPPLGIAGLFLTLALFDVLPLLPGWMHAGVLAALTAAFVWTLWRAIPAFRLPAHGSAQRRLETESRLEHRPLALAEDQLAGGRGDPLSEAMWRAHRRQMLKAIGRLRVGLPVPGLAARDPWALRAALALCLVVGFVVAGGGAVERVGRALSPDIAGFAPLPPAALEVWITPPDYTGLAPRVMRFGAAQETESRANGGTISVPAGSTMLAQLHGGRGTPYLQGPGGEQEFSEIAPGNGSAKASFQIEGKVESGGRMRVIQSGHEIGAWKVAIVPDEPPRVSFAHTPTATPRASLRIDFEAHDDFGVTSVKAVIERADGTHGSVGGKSLTIDLPLPARSPKDVKATSYQDLTAHPWAGLPVTAQLIAMDAKGQSAPSGQVTFTLPEREFHDPIARRLVQDRKALVRDPGQRQVVALDAARIASHPNDYRNDIVVFLALKSVHDRLLRDRREAAIDEVQKLLWDTALRVEEGEVPLAERQLRQAQKELMDALARDADNAEIQRLMDQLQRAMQKYFRSLAQDMQRHPERYQGALPLDAEMRELRGQDLQRMLDRIRELAQTGSKQAARQLLAQLQSMLENLRFGQMGKTQQGDNPAAKAMRSLQDLARRQQGLMDRTFQNARRGQEPGSSGQMPDSQALQAQQEALRRGLGEIMRNLSDLTGKIPGALGRAEGAMRDASRALGSNRPGEALGPQGEALENLRSGMSQAMKQLQGKFGSQYGFDPNQTGRFTEGDRDPLGRPLDENGRAWGSDVKVPDKGSTQRARQILDELRRRAGENQRPREELDYIHRLLRQF